MNDSDASTPQLYLSLFGGFHMARHGKAIHFATDRTCALLAYLAVESDQSQRREALATLLWPEDLESSARANLRQTLTRLRKALDDDLTNPTFLWTNRSSAQLLRPSPMVVDVLAFQEQLSGCSEHEYADPSHCDRCLERQITAVELYRGPFLDGTQLVDSSPFEAWARSTRDYLQRQVLEALHALSENYAAKGDQRLAQQYAARQLALEPWRESAHRQLMLALARNGQRGAALAQYESCRRLLAEELAAEPEAATVTLLEQIRSGEVAQSAAKAIDDPVKEAAAGPTYRSADEILARSPDQLRGQSVPAHEQNLFGVGMARTQVESLLQTQSEPWIISIDGIGGMGKTAMAVDLAYGFMAGDRFADILWVSAKQEEFHAAVGIQSIEQSELDEAMLIDSLLEQLLEQAPSPDSDAEKRRMIQGLLKTQPYLVVVDNLESADDVVSLIPALRRLANPSKFLLTSRYNLKSHTDVYNYTLRELGESDTLALLRHEAQARGIDALQSASAEQLATIYQVVGGLPLALKLVVGQVGFLPLPQVLKHLSEAQGKRVDELYTYIYWQAWQLLDDDERRLFLSMPLAPDATFDQLALASALDVGALQGALTRLIEHSLVLVSGGLNERRYGLHRLTETFLMHEVLKWQAQT